MKAKNKKILIYAVSIVLALAVGGISTWIKMGDMNNTALTQPPLSPSPWVFPVVWTILFTLMGISAAKVYEQNCTGKTDSLFLYIVQLIVNFLWTVFYFKFEALGLSFFWLLFLILLVILMAVRFERCSQGSGKLQIPYIIWLCFAAYLNFSSWMLNR